MEARSTSCNQEIVLLFERSRQDLSDWTASDMYRYHALPSQGVSGDKKKIIESYSPSDLYRSP